MSGGRLARLRARAKGAERYCRRSLAKAKADSARAILAKHIIAAAQDSERDEGRLRDGALVALAQ
jgi:hypothetical protein